MGDPICPASGGGMPGMPMGRMPPCMAPCAAACMPMCGCCPGGGGPPGACMGCCGVLPGGGGPIAGMGPPGAPPMGRGAPGGACAFAVRACEGGMRCRRLRELALKLGCHSAALNPISSHSLLQPPAPARCCTTQHPATHRTVQTAPQQPLSPAQGSCFAFRRPGCAAAAAAAAAVEGRQGVLPWAAAHPEAHPLQVAVGRTRLPPAHYAAARAAAAASACAAEGGACLAAGVRCLVARMRLVGVRRKAQPC